MDREQLDDLAIFSKEIHTPQEVVGLLEVRAYSVDFVDEVLHANDTMLSKLLLDDGIVSDGDALLVDFSIATLVDELADSTERRAAVSNVGIDKLKHLLRRSRKLDKGAIVDLEQAKELHDLAGLGGDLVDTVRLMKACSTSAGQDFGGSRGRVAATYPLMRTTNASLASAGT